MKDNYEIEDYLARMSNRMMEDMAVAVQLIGENGDENHLVYLHRLKDIMTSISYLVQILDMNLKTDEALHNMVNDFLKVSTLDAMRDILKSS